MKIKGAILIGHYHEGLTCLEIRELESHMIRERHKRIFRRQVFHTRLSLASDTKNKKDEGWVTGMAHDRAFGELADAPKKRGPRDLKKKGR